MTENEIKIYGPGKEGPGFKRVPNENFSRRQGKVPLKDGGGTIWVTLQVYKTLMGFGESGSGDLPLSIEPRVLEPLDISGED